MLNPLLEDKNWLYKTYIEEKISIYKIARILKCRTTFIRKALINFNFKIRTKADARPSRKGDFKTKELKNKEWLYDKYIVEKLSQSDIAKLLNCNCWSIKAALNFHNIAIRSQSDSIKMRHSKNLNRSKYPLLNNKEWLYQKAIVEKFSYQKIAKLVGTLHFQTVCLALKKYNIFERRRQRERVVGKSSYEQLNDKRWLKQKYLKEKLSTLEIGKIVGCNCALVFQTLKRNNIKVRDRSFGHIYKQNAERDGFKINKKTLPIIIGGLLGDANLGINKNYGNPSYSKSSIHKEYLEYEGKILFGKKYNERISVCRKTGEATFKRYNGCSKIYKTKKAYTIRSLRYKELLPLFNKWYKKVGNKNIKVIPDNLKIANKTILTWFMDDGYSYIVRSKRSKAQLRIYFATQGFQYNELKKLSKKIEKEFGLHLYVRFHQRKGVHDGSGYELELSLKDVELFYKIVGPCPVKCFEYKWKLKHVKKLWAQGL